MIHSEMLLAQQDVPLTYVFLLLALVVVGVALFVLLRRSPQAGAKAGAQGVRTARDATVVFRPEHRENRGGRATVNYTVLLPDDDGTYLVPLLDDAGTPGQPIAVHARSLYIGRDATRAQIIFADPSVSRLHARLVEEGDGVFMLHDEGSASGTYVNDERIDLQPRRLKSGDLIEFGRQRVLFQSAELIGEVATAGSQG